ncbi:MAG TPA: DUF1007 family protein [Stellaceae bacterium]|nr:DUF1007 family protein [Stellaceae bacterium]
MTASIRILLVALAGFAFVAPARAHPHIWVTMKVDLLYAPDGAISGVRHAWAFDDMYSVFATQGMDQKTKGVFTREELAPLAKVNMDTLKESGYFTYVTADGEKIPFLDPPTDYWLDYKDTVLTLHFTLPFKQPVKAKNLLIEIYDPTIYVDFEFAKENPVSAVGAPAQCKLTFKRPPDMRFVQGKILGEAFFNSLTPAQNWGAKFANKILIDCR